MRYLLSYDLNKPGQNYQVLWDELKRFDAKRTLLSQWCFRRINTTPANLRDHFKTFIDSNDRLVIVEVDGDSWAAWNPINKISDM